MDKGKNKKIKESKNIKKDEIKKIGNRGFSFVEILAAIVIIGILMSISIVAFSRYKDKAKNNDYEALAKASYNAMEQYVMDHPYEKKANLDTLVDNNLLSNRQDPGSPDNECTGYVEIEGAAGGSGKLDSGKYTVYLCCASYKKKYTYPDGTVENYTGTDRCSAPDVAPTPPPGETSYTITYVLNGGSVSGNPSRYSTSTLPITLKNPIRSGYTFDGWTGTGLSGKTKNVVITNGSTGNRTYTANWTASSTPPSTSTYTITLNNNGATSGGTGSVKVKVGNTKLPAITNPKKVVTITYVNKVGATVSGGDKSKTYTLNGWYTTATNGSKVASSATTPVLQKSISGYTDANGKWIREKNTTLYAQWAPVTATLPKITKNGSTCRWKASDGSLVASGGTWKFTSANSRTFTADCTSTLYTVTLNNNGATAAGTASVKVSVGDKSLPAITKPKKVVTITYVNKEGAVVNGGDVSKSYTIDGWYTNATGGSKVADNSGSPALQANVKGFTDGSKKWTRTSSATLYAQWTPVTATLPTIKKAGHTCIWTTDNGASTVASGGKWKFTSANSRTFTVKCEPKSVTVTFDCNGGKITGTSNPTGTSKYTVGKAGNKFDKTCIPNDASKKHDGWKLHAKDTAKKYETANGVRDDWIEANSPSITLYAHYEPKKLPTCQLKISNNPPQSNGWYRGSVKIDMTTTGTPTQYGLATTEKSTNKVTSVTVTKSGTITYYGYVKNADGDGKCYKTVKIDVDAPKCGVANGSSTTWTKNNRTIKQPCTDSHSGCVNNTYQVTYSSTTRTANITISDKAGNTRPCPVNVYVDKTIPVCGTASGSSTTWIRGNRTITQVCKDDHSGCAGAATSVTYSSTTRTANITIRDKVGNTKTCPVNVYVDKTEPICSSSSGSSTTWTSGNRTITEVCKDDHSGCASTSSSATFSSTTKTGTITIRDKVGNTKACPVNVYVDKTKPTISGASKSDGNYKLSATIGDAHSGLKSYTWQGYSATSVSGTSKSVSKSTGSSDGNITLTVTDQAGNSNSYKFTGVYKYCSSTVSKDTLSLYHWYGMKKNCSYNNPYRTYDFRQYDCDCKMDKKDTKHFCSRSTKDTTMSNHGSKTSIIYYKKKSNDAVAACKGNSGTYANGFVREVCASNNYFSGDSTWLYHGYKFYRGKVSTSEGYVNFSGNCWTYWGKSVLSSSLSANDACTQACKNKFG